MIYKFKNVTFLNTTRLDAQSVGETLEAIRDINNGELRKEDVIEFARPHDSPIHNAFTWDNEKAADKYRLAEAKDLINAVVVVNEETGDTLPAFMSVRVAGGSPFSKDTSYYQSVRVVQNNPREYYAVLKAALADLDAAGITLHQLAKLAPGAEQDKVGMAEASVLHATRSIQSIQVEEESQNGLKLVGRGGGAAA